MNPSQPPWDDLRILLAVHRGGSLLAAGKALGVATSTVARRLEALEAALGRPVLHRGNGGTTVAGDALALVSLGEQIELGLAAIRRRGATDAVSGTVRVSVIEGSVRPLVRLLAGLLVKHPALRFEIAAESRLVDLARREADIGIRIARAGTPTLIEKHVGKMKLAVFGAPSYVERRLPGGRLGREDAARHDWVAFDRALEKLPSEGWLRAYGAKRFVVRSSTSIALEEAILAGIGLGILGEAQGASLGLVRVDTQATPPPVDVFLAFHRDAKHAPGVRAVLRAIEAEMRRFLV